MKQEIVCSSCRKELRELFPTDTPYPMEHVKFVDGRAKADYLCDQCGDEILPFQHCTAFSIWADHGTQSYYEWEDKYVEVIQ